MPDHRSEHGGEAETGRELPVAQLLRENAGQGPESRLGDKEFHAIRGLVYSKFGISLGEQKRSLVVTRLQRVLRERGFKDFTEYCAFLENDSSGEGLNELVNRITTNHTFFFREKAHFDFITGKALPEITASLERRGTRDLRIWCAGCATGEEPYTLAMLLLEFFGPRATAWDAGVLATDISAKALGTATRGLYPDDRVSETPPQFRHKYFTKSPDGQWRITDTLKKEVTFRRLNLMNPVFPFKKPFQIILCRNVMIYFDQASRSSLINRFHQNLEQGGYLFIGHSETLGRDQSLFEYVMPAVYRKG